MYSDESLKDDFPIFYCATKILLQLYLLFCYYLAIVSSTIWLLSTILVTILLFVTIHTLKNSIEPSCGVLVIT